jgi:hypothetical protein
MILTPRTRRCLRALAIVVIGAGPLLAVPEAPAQGVPDPPAFSNPLEITHSYFTVAPGTVKVYEGRESGQAVTVVETHLDEVRSFPWAGGDVPCRVVEELKFRSGLLLERDRTFYAQADDGAVWTFGTTEDGEDEEVPDPGEPEEEPGGWVVGDPAPEDPPGVEGGAAPAVAMPAVPAPGSSWTTEEVPPHFHSVQILEDDRATVRIPAGRFENCFRVREENLVEGSGDTLWFAPGTGLVRSRGPGEVLKLRATTLRP